MDIGDLERKLGIDGLSADEQMALLDALQKSAQSRLEIANQEAIGKSTEVVIQGLKKIKSDLETRFTQLNATIESKASSLRDGKDGKDGKNGKDGLDGKQGLQGSNGQNGRDGRDGLDGTDGISVTSARIDFDGSLVIGLSSGAELNVGEVVAPDLAESIKVITNGGGTSQSVLDSIASLQNQINTLIPSQTGNSGKYLTTNGTTTSWGSVTGGLSYQGTWNASTNSPALTSSVGTQNNYYIVGTSGSTNLNGITDWVVGDWLIFNGSVWQKIDTTDLVVSVAGRTGAVTLTTADVSGLGTMSTQNASSVAITGGTATLTSLTTPTVQATNSSGLSLKNSAGTTQLSMGAGGGDNLSLNVSTNINGTNAQVDISPTGTGHVHIKPTGVNSVEIAPTYVGDIDNMIIGAVTPKNGSFVDLSVTGTTSFDGSQGTSGQVLTSAGSGNTPTWSNIPTLNQNTTGSAGSLATTNFTIEESGGKLLFKYGATTIASMSSTGVITSATNIIANGTP
jgi:hypothetical protein